MSKINYCLAIRKAKKEEILAEIGSNKSLYTYFEVWLDYIDNLDVEFVKELISLTEEKLILLTRRNQLEKEKISPAKTLEIAKILSGTETLLDFDVSSQLPMIKVVSEQAADVNLLLSYHNYSLSPSNQELKELYDQMLSYNPKIYKFATFCKEENDAVRLLNFGLKLRDAGVKYIVLGMGEHGAATRIFGTLWGNEMIFCPVSKNELTAPGQLSREQLEKIWDLLPSTDS